MGKRVDARVEAERVQYRALQPPCGCCHLLARDFARGGSRYLVGSTSSIKTRRAGAKKSKRVSRRRAVLRTRREMGHLHFYCVLKPWGSPALSVSGLWSKAVEKY